MKRKLFLLLCALLTSVGMWAQGTWTAPAVPGVDPSTVDGTTTYYLYNVESDAFVAYGMSWQSQAIARRLCNGDQAASDMHKMTASISDSKLSFHFNDVKDANRLLSDNSGENNCYVDTWTGNATKFTYAATTTSGAYTLTNVETGHELDVHWKYGGHLTGTNGQGFTAWAIIPETSVTDGSYAKYKERKQLYGVYQALVNAGVVSSYTSALETANAVYVNASSTVAELRSATRTLINTAAEDIASSINGNSLFDDTDMWGNQALTTWTSTAASNSDFGEYETYNIKYDFNQTHDVPNGSYKIVFHSLFRNDGSDAAPRIIVTDGEKDGGGTTASANVPLFSSMSFLPTNSNSSSNMSVAKQSYFSDWTNANIPNGRRSSADAMAHTGAVAVVDNFKVTNGKMDIRMVIDGNSQWVNFQGFDIIFYGSTTGKLYRDLVDLLETSNTLKDQPMNADVKTALTTAISTYSSLTKSSSEEELETAITDVTTANNNANTSIANYTEANTILTAASSLSSVGQTIYANNETVSAIQSAYDNRSLVAVTDEQETACNAALAAVEAWLEIKDYADALVAVENTNAEANATLASAISTQNTAATSATTTATVTTATSTLKTAMITYAGAADPTSGNRFNLTFMLTNPDVTGLPTWTGAAGWYTEQDGGNSQVMTNDAAAGPHGNAFYEYWSEAAAANDKFTLYQKVTLPEGTYSMECDAFSSQPTGGDNCAVYFYANDTQGDLVSNYPMATKTISFVNGSEQEVKIGLKALAGNTYRWMGIGYVELYKVPAQTYTVDEDQAWDNSQSGAGDVTLKRTIKAGVNTLVLPFSMTQTEVENKFGTGSKVYAVSSYNAETENISFVVRDGISANQPCLLKATEAGTTYELTDRTIVAGTPTSSGTNVTLTGSYAASISVPQATSNYIVSGDNLYQVNSTVTMKNTRAYITISGESGARLSLRFDDDDATIISALEAADAEAGAQKDGKYLENGKIVIVKNGVKYGANGQKLN